MDEAQKAWSIMTKARNGVVSVVRDLTLVEARQMYERLDPWYGRTITQYEHPDGSVYSRDNWIGHSDGTIEQIEVFGPPDWDADEVYNWRVWPKFVTLKAEEDLFNLATPQPAS